jgi:hypothetical protein
MLVGAFEWLTMETELQKLEAEALKLTADERAALAQRLLASLDEDAEMMKLVPWRSIGASPRLKAALFL